MVEPDSRDVMTRAANRVDERLPTRAVELPRVERGQPPVLAVAEELVGRRADPHPRREVVLPSPGVEAVGRKANRDVGDEADLARGLCQLAIDVELEPL